MWYRISAWTPVLADTSASIFGSIGGIFNTGIGIGTTLLLRLLIWIAACDQFIISMFLGPKIK